MTFCRIAQVFNDSQGSLRVPNFTLSCKIGMLSATPEDRYATPLGVATPSLRSPVLGYCVTKTCLFFFTLNTISCFILSRDVEAEAVEAVKFLWKQKWKHFNERDRKRKRTRKRLILSGAGSGNKKFQRWGSGSELGSIKLQEELQAEALKIWLLPHPCLKQKIYFCNFFLEIRYSKIIFLL